MITYAVRTDLAPTGRLRVGINYGNPVLASKDPGTLRLEQDPEKVAREMAKLRRRMRKQAKSGGQDKRKPLAKNQTLGIAAFGKNLPL